MKIKQLGLFALLFAQAGFAQDTNEKLMAKAKKIHEKVITIDTHNDINVNNFTHDHNYTEDLDTQVNLPKMDEGDLDVSWLIVYTGQGDLDTEGYKKAYDNAISKFEAIHRLTEEIAPDEIGLATTSKEVRKLVKQGKKVAMIGVENGYPIGTDIKNVEKFYDIGARYMSLAHNGHSQLSDSNTGEADDEWLNNGLSDLGKEVIKEMNRLGIMIDVSHPSKEAIKQMFELSKAPLIASHSSARALCDHSRNLDDELLALFDKHGGVIQTVAFSSYVNTEKHEAFNAAKTEVYEAKAKEMGFEMLSWGDVRELDEEAREKYIENYRKLVTDSDKEVEALKETVSPVDVSDFVDHIDYLVEKVGIDQVGISSDFDGGGGIDGWDDASESFNVTLELVKRGYTEKEIAKLWGENLLRVLDEVEAIAKDIQKA
ncbi:membrane dipeptidase [Zunongwangia mangrovi]|uniref:Membrane dipeptidase n=1 Tax=Zunongwangia mangrovi TaxID=1334022 RepID=A0A1I1FWE8_9FLAO|nr:membrane dipeptidase [Zunongwangia mangrovi]SFC03356.1 membrane dipeptidase [Zunongwangia mangrovi]